MNSYLVKYSGIYFLSFILIMLSSCDSDDDVFDDSPVAQLQESCKDLGEGWSIPKNQVVGGGVGKDGIPAIENPQFIPIDQADFMLDEEFVIGVEFNGEFRAYSHRIMEKHEIANDFIGDQYYSLTFCPLTGTALVWDREKDNSFGVSGLLHNSNLIPYDRETGSNWSQMFARGISGTNICESVTNFRVIETTWDTWRNFFPDSKILSFETGFTRNYGQPPASMTQPENLDPLFPLTNHDSRLPNYERVLLVVIDGHARAYRFSAFKKGGDVINDFFAGRLLIVRGDEDKNILIPYLHNLDGPRSFSYRDNEMVDTEGNTYNLFGEIIDGPDLGLRLSAPYSMIGYWFSVAAFYPDVDIYEGF